MQRINTTFFVMLLFVSVLAACSAQATQVQPTATPSQIVEPPLTQSTANLPQTDAEVPRISLEEARVALEEGEAIFVDVRRSDFFEESHISGATSIPLGDIEENPAGLTLDKEQWIITYCS
jgi:hypothetical protein